MSAVRHMPPQAQTRPCKVRTACCVCVCVSWLTSFLYRMMDIQAALTEFLMEMSAAGAL